MAEIPRYVIDASIAAKWHLKDEEHSSYALAVLNDFQEGRVELIAPRFIRYEVASAIFKAVRRQRLPIGWAYESVQAIDSWGVHLTIEDSLYYACDRAYWLGASLYDGIYVATAISAGCPLLSADDHLRRASAGKYVFYTWIADYKSPA